MSIADHPSNRRQRPLEAPVTLPWYRAAHRGLETCAYPGECDLEANTELEIDGVDLGFCEAHAILIELFSDVTVVMAAMDTLMGDEEEGIEYDLGDDIDRDELVEQWLDFDKAFPEWLDWLDPLDVDDEA